MRTKCTNSSGQDTNYYPICYLINKQKISLERRMTSRGEDYLYCPNCREESSGIIINPGEVECWCFRCNMTTVHKVVYTQVSSETGFDDGAPGNMSELMCKACGKVIRVDKPKDRELWCFACNAKTTHLSSPGGEWAYKNCGSVAK